ncbi:hypothetical protein VN12_16660 [Pirellula sp. SH-Sr6A]|uniref:hypothetical protein n=1 Tax=Pirellula sp. SH-Sr6A TaxID=1632865 RepID=UPI00078EB3DF|nr:hypothetical protein [Pirellula sp. SH-Sr6A]AMV33763.1 hypothetical protein VN12_16660 [Pirellula sp. SH-Sr6A]
MKEQNLPLFEYANGCARDNEVQEIARSSMISTTEVALDFLGIGREDAAGKLLRTVVRLCGLRPFTRTRMQLLKELDCSQRTLQRILRRLQDSGLVRVGHVAGNQNIVAIQAVWTNIVEMAEQTSEVIWASDARNHSKESSKVAVGATFDATSTATSGATSTRHEAGIDATREATSERHRDDIGATFENPSLYNANTLNRCRSRFEEAATTAVDRNIGRQEIEEAFHQIVKCVPRHQQTLVADVAWELAFVCLVAQQLTGCDHLAEQRDSIRSKERLTSPANYLRNSARGICDDVGLGYLDLRSRCPKRPPSPALERRTLSKPPASPVFVEPPQRATGFSDEERQLIASFGRRTRDAPT